MNPKTKTFDSVEMMRRLRDQLSAEMAAMSPEEQILYVQKKAAASPLAALFVSRGRTQKTEPVVRPAV
jgi:hypothetical protein